MSSMTSYLTGQSGFFKNIISAKQSHTLPQIVSAPKTPLSCTTLLYRCMRSTLLSIRHRVSATLALLRNDVSFPFLTLLLKLCFRVADILTIKQGLQEDSNFSENVSLS